MEDQRYEHKPGSNELDASLNASRSIVSGNASGSDNGQLEVQGEAGFKYPPGYRFHPYDHELVVFYLKSKVFHMYVPPDVIQDVELYKFSPDQLAASFKPHDGRMWYFFTPRDRKYKNGDRPNRTAEAGYWKATGADKDIMYLNAKVGHRKALVFYQGKAPNGRKTNWIMHEYRLKDPPKRERAGTNDMRLDDWVLCRIYKKPYKSSRGRSSTRTQGDSDNEVDQAEHEDTHAHVSTESNILGDQEIAIPPSSSDINGFNNLQATEMPPFNSYDSVSFRIFDDIRCSESPQSKQRDNKIWDENDNNENLLAPVPDMIPPYYYGNGSHQATRMQYFSTYDNVAPWQNLHGMKNRPSPSPVPQSRFHPYMQNATPSQHMTPIHPNTRCQKAVFEKYDYQNSVYQSSFAVLAMPGSSTTASQSSESHVKVEPSSSQPGRQSVESQMNDNFKVVDDFTCGSSDESCLHEQYFNSGDY